MGRVYHPGRGSVKLFSRLLRQERQRAHRRAVRIRKLERQGEEGEEAAAAGAAAITGGRLTHFEKLCDDAVTAYLAGARYVAFGEAPLIGYLAARETELTNVRVILSGRLAGLDADTIRERLRESYV